MKIKQLLLLSIMLPILLGASICYSAAPENAQTVEELVNSIESLDELTNYYKVRQQFKKLSKDKKFGHQDTVLETLYELCGHDLETFVPYALYLVDNGISPERVKVFYGQTPLRMAIDHLNVIIPHFLKEDAGAGMWNVAKRFVARFDKLKTAADKPEELLLKLVEYPPASYADTSTFENVFEFLLNKVDLAEHGVSVAREVKNMYVDPEHKFQAEYKNVLIDKLAKSRISEEIFTQEIGQTKAQFFITNLFEFDFLQEHDLDLNAQDAQGNTAMHDFVSQEDIPFKQLEKFAAHADLSIANDEGQTPVDVLLELWNANKPTDEDDDFEKKMKRSRLLVLVILMNNGAMPSDKEKLDPLLLDVFTQYGSEALSSADNKVYLLSAQNKSVSVPPLLEIAQKLIDKGADVEPIKERFFQQYSHQVASDLHTAASLRDDSHKKSFENFVERHGISDIHEQYKPLLKPSKPEPNGSGKSRPGKDDADRKIKPIHVVAGGAAAVGLVGAAVYAWKWYKKRQKEKAYTAELAGKKGEREKAKQQSEQVPAPSSQPAAVDSSDDWDF